MENHDKLGIPAPPRDFWAGRCDRLEWAHRSMQQCPHDKPTVAVPSYDTPEVA